ncbi:MAG: Asp23/Gls24 family envelope stress response protein [Anaerolineaceae bacterium]|nr:Asp23/Gls24 family envelope stress response protein [Anaerolineaceae bacterium]
MSPVQPQQGKTTIEPDVLVAIARLAALNVPGVNRLTTIPGTVDRLFQRGATEGVHITLENNVVSADLYVILNREVNVRDVSRSIQAQVARAISEMVGMEVGRIDIHVEDIDYASTTA